jgi:hypothetical protein
VWRVCVNAPPDCTCSEFLTWFVPAFLLEAQKRNHIVESLDHLGCYRQDWFNFYLLPKKREELDEYIVEVLSGDHPARVGRLLHRVAWGSCEQDTPLSQFLLGDVDHLVLPSPGRVATPRRQLKDLMCSFIEHPDPIGPLGYYRSIDALVARLRQCTDAHAKTPTLAMCDGGHALPVMKEGFLMNLDPVPMDPPGEDKYLVPSVRRVLAACTSSMA